MAKAGVIGLDIGTTHVRAAEVAFGKSGGPGTLVRYGEVALPLGAVRDGEVADHGVVSAAIRHLWGESKFPSKDVNIGVGNQRVLVRELDLPWMPLAQMKASLPFHVQEMLPMAIEDTLLDFFPTGQSDTPTGILVHGLLVAAAKDTVRANVMAVESAGLRPRLVDLNSFALMRSVVRDDLMTRTVAVVDIGARITQVVVSAGGAPQFVRLLPSGGQNVTDGVARALGISATEAEDVKRQIGIGMAAAPEMSAAVDAIDEIVRPLVEAIRNTFVYYSSKHTGAGIEVVVLTGGGAALPGFGQYLASASRLPVSLGDPLHGLRTRRNGLADELAPYAASLAIPIGLAYGVAA